MKDCEGAVRVRPERVRTAVPQQAYTIQRGNELCPCSVDPRAAASALKDKSALVYVPATQPAGLAQSVSCADVASRVPIHHPRLPFCYLSSERLFAPGVSSITHLRATTLPVDLPMFKATCENMATRAARGFHNHFFKSSW